MDHLTEKGLVLCTICGQKFTSEITHLSEPIDVYSEWIDACEEANMQPADHCIRGTSFDDFDMFSVQSCYKMRVDCVCIVFGGLLEWVGIHCLC